MRNDDKATIENHFRGDYLKFYSHFLADIKSGGNGQSMVKCPFHEDHSPSLSIDLKSGLFNCFGCGAQGDVFSFYAKLHNIQLRTDFPKVLAGIAKDFGIDNANTKQQAAKSKVVARYEYQDESGNLVFQIERLEPKSFRIRRPNGNGGWIYNKDNVRIFPYHLPEILKTDGIILIVEGEKDADNLTALGFTATTNPFGAEKVPEDFGQYFKDKTVVLIPDNDAPGRAHARQWYQKLKPYSWEIKYLPLPDLSEKGDVSDFIASCSSKIEAAEKLSELISDAPLYQEEKQKEEISQQEKQNRGFHFRSASDLCAAPTATEWLIKNIIDVQAFADYYGESGSMKTFGAMDMGLSISVLQDWHGYEVRQNGLVFYIAGEGFSGLSKRIRAWSIYHGVDLQDIPFFVSDRAARFLDDPEQVLMAIDELRTAHGVPIFIIVDTLSRNFGSGDENSTMDMARFIGVIDDLRNRYHCAVMVVHHTGLTATDRARGASALKAALDWEYRLQKKSDGTRLLTCTKAKDHEEPKPICFMPEVVIIDGWIDPDDGEVMTSLILRRVENGSDYEKPLSGPRKIALDALLSISDESVHIDTWREAAYAAGISTAPSTEAKKKAFQRAIKDLHENGYIETKDNLWWLRDKGQKRDNVGTCPTT